MKKRDDIYLSQIADRILKIRSHLRGVSKARFSSSELHRSAIVRELEVIGEAARFVSHDTKDKFPAVPWPQLIGMRNRLIHEYFDVDFDIVWNVARVEIPRLQRIIEKAILETAPASHPWRACPLGYYYVRPHARDSLNDPVMVREHCRRNPSGKDQLYPKEIRWITERRLAHGPLPGSIGKLRQPKNANDFDPLTVLWVTYWNDVFTPAVPLYANIVKALFASESSFRLDVKPQRISTRNFARGPLQITDHTREILADEKGELKDHYLTLTKEDVRDPGVSLCASIRWLFHKKTLASKYLGREASWEEAIADYKGYLRKTKPFREQKGMKSFFDFLNKLETGDGG